MLIERGTLENLEDIVRFQLEMAMESEGTALDAATVRAGVEAALRDPSRGWYFVAKCLPDSCPAEMTEETHVEERRCIPAGITEGIHVAAEKCIPAESGEENAGRSVIGSLMVTREWSDWNNCDYWWIQSVYVRPEFRGRGVFTKMYAEVKRLAREAGSTSLRLYVDRGNSRARAAYSRLGMSPSHYEMYEEDLQPLP